ncbi:hypothetical protein ALC62_02663 [Cyphomyrmex costatus]|uniref:Uncharacterized protein n=1 Tax=Cyphomyrmex costatus TaxID=456900 RepID=A0A195D0E1_9HYME|nr:hypothetical protein ALC62_02663 [Cyphomyrmex costatus]
MVMQHAAHLENLSSYTGPRGRVAPVLPEHSGWIANRHTFPRSPEIYSRELRMNATSVHRTGDDTRWNLSRVNHIPNSKWKEGGDVCFRLCFGGAIEGIRQIVERTVEDRERNLSIVRTDRHIMGSNDDDTTAYVSHHLTRFMCSLIACREYDARCRD